MKEIMTINKTNEIQDRQPIQSCGKKGFSLIELIVTISIMAVLVGVLSPNLLRYIEKARAQKDDYNMSLYTRSTSLVFCEAQPYTELMNFSKSANTDTIRIVFTPNNGTMYVDTAKMNGGALLTAYMGLFSNELKSNVADYVMLTSNTYHDCPYTIEIKIPGAYSRFDVVGYWGVAVNTELNVSNMDNTLRDLFEGIMGSSTVTNFLVLNSTYTNNNKTIQYLNNGLAGAGDGTDIKTWSILKDGTNKNATATQNNTNYLFSTVDISNKSEWNAGDKIPAIMQKSDGTYVVGLGTLYKQTDGPAGNKEYYVISRDRNGKYAHNSDYDMNSVLIDTRNFSTLDEAYAYYQTLEIVKVQ